MNFEFSELSKTASTNDYLKQIKEYGTEYVVVAKRQTGGKGRLGRRFVSEEGGLYMSVSYTPEKGVLPQQTIHYTALAALAVREVLMRFANTSELNPNFTFDIKWPNDIYLNGKKVCGILTESVHLGNEFYMIFGIGINLTNNISKEVEYASSIFELTGISLDRTALAKAIAEKLLTLLSANSIDFKPYMAEYKQSCITIGKKVKTDTLCGVAVDIDENAQLLIKTESGRTETVFFGEALITGI